MEYYNVTNANTASGDKDYQKMAESIANEILKEVQSQMNINKVKSPCVCKGQKQK